MIWPFTIKPYQVQIEALRRSDGKRDFAFFMEMGLGKTAAVLAEYCRYRETKLINKLVVICPNSLKSTWLGQIEKFGVKAVVSIWPDFTGVEDILIMNYEATITQRGQQCLQKILPGGTTMLVLDESIHIKSFKARRTKTLIAIAEYAAFRRILSGKPVVQGAHDLWAQLRFIYGHRGMNYFQFRARYCKMGGYLGKQVVGVQNATELYEMVDRTAFRARKDDWLDLPPKIYQTRKIELTAEQRKHYRNLERDLITTVRQQEIVTTMALTAMVKMQQVTSGFILDPNGTAIDIPGGNPKLDALLELMEEVKGKTIIFCYFRYSVVQIKLALAKAGYYAASFMGGDDPHVIAEFNQDPKMDTLVVQIQSGKYGHTMLGTPEERCATTVFYENSYSLDARSQAEDRNHRIGQTLPVVYIDFVTSELDEDIIDALQRKEDVALAVIDNIRRS